jgi:hypothetical protein
MAFLTQFPKSMKKYYVNILLGYYFKIFGEALIQDFWSWYYFFGKVPLSNFVCGIALKSYIRETDFSDKNMFFDKKIVCTFFTQFSKSMRKYRFIILLGYYIKIFGEVLIQYLLLRYYFENFQETTAFKFFAVLL